MSKEKEDDNKTKEDETMNAYAVKSNMSFVTNRKLERTPATKENKNMVDYMDSHDFFVQIDINTGEVRSRVIEQNGNKKV